MGHRNEQSTRIPNRRLPWDHRGPYYCSVGAKNAHGRHMIEEHLDICLDAGINVEGINAEVAAGQWGIPVLCQRWQNKLVIKFGWLAICLSVSAKNMDSRSSTTPNHWAIPTGTAPGCTPTSQTQLSASVGDQAVYDQVCKAFEPRVSEHIAVYGADNDQRLTGKT